MDIGKRILQALEKQGLNMAELARRSGIGQGRISQIVSGRTKSPRGDTISKLAKALGVTEGWLLTGEGEISGKAAEEGAGYIDPELVQAVAKKLKAEYEGKAIELTGEELMAVQMLRDLSDHDRQRIIHMLQMAWAAGKVGEKG